MCSIVAAIWLCTLFRQGVASSVESPHGFRLPRADAWGYVGKVGCSVESTLGFRLRRSVDRVFGQRPGYSDTAAVYDQREAGYDPLQRNRWQRDRISG